MEQMIDVIKREINNGFRHKYTDEDIQKLGDYLIGKADFKSVEDVVPKDDDGIGFISFSNIKLREIAEVCMEKPELLPRLRRFLTVIKNKSPKFFTIVSVLMDNGMPLAKIFIEAGMGPEAIVECVGAKDYWHDGHIARMLEYVDSSHPGVIEAYLEKTTNRAQLLRPLVWFCGKHGIDVDSEHPYAKKLAETMLYFGGCTALCNELDYPFKANLRQKNPALADMLEKGPVANEIKQTNLNYGLARYFYSALCLSGFGLSEMNTIPAALCLANYHQFLHTLVWTRHRELPDQEVDLSSTYPRSELHTVTESIVRQMRELEEIVAKLGIHIAYLHAWAHNCRQYAPGKWTAALRELETDPELLQMALEYPEPVVQTNIIIPSSDLQLGDIKPVGRTSLYRFLYDLGQPLSEDAANVCVEVLQSRVPESCLEAAERLGQYLLTGEGDVTALPWMDEYYTNGYSSCWPPEYDLDVSIWALAGVHPIAQRYAAYLAVHNEISHIKNMVEYLENAYGWNPQQTAEFIMDSGPHKYMISVVASCEQVNEAKDNSIIKSAFPICVAMDLDAAAEAMQTANAAGKLVLLDAIYKAKPNYDEELLTGCLGDKSKKLRQSAYGYLAARPELADKIRPLTEAKKKDIREAAERLMAVYEGGQETGGDESAENIIASCAKILPKNWLNSVKWAFPADLPSARLKDSEQKADDVIVQCYFYLMLSNKTMEMPPAAPRLRAALNEDDLRKTACQVYEQWIADNAPAKQKSAMFLYGVHAGDAEVIALHKQLSKWADESRGAIAADAVRAMVYSTSSIALMTIDSIARKFKNKMVRKAAQESFAHAAVALGVPAEVLGDRIIPTLGFDANGEKVIDYGTRKFTAFLSPSLQIDLRDENGKNVKSLPKPGAKDNAEIAEKAKKEFAALKKSLKAVVTTQTQRLEQALSTGRRWEPSAWEKLFVQNPIMHTFAIGLIWGAYDGDELREAFRYMEDGTFTTVEDDEFDFGSIGAGEIGLVHPLDLGEEATAAWQQQLEDYEIAQPIVQVGRPVYTITGEEKNQYGLARVAGRQLVMGAMMSKLEKNGWYKGSVGDGGFFNTFYKEVGDIGMQLYFSGTYIGGTMETIIVGEAAFYKAGTIQRGSYSEDSFKEAGTYKLGEVSPRMFSELVHELEGATASSGEFVEDWAKEFSMKVEFEKASHD